MNETLFASPSLPTFLVASLILTATPGPGVIYIVARTLAQGRRAGLASVTGVACGNLANAVAAAAGLAALIAASSLAFTIVKYVGAAYLVYLGIRMLGAGSTPATTAFGASEVAPIFRQGFVVALLNPKTALFFAAFLPQFIDPAASPLRQSVFLGSLFVVIAVATDSLYVLVAGAAYPALTRQGRRRYYARFVGACVLIGLGVFAAVTGSHSNTRG